MTLDRSMGKSHSLKDFDCDDAETDDQLDSLTGALKYQFVYSQGDVRNTAQQPVGSINRLQYLAVNMIFQPTPYTFVGSELLWGNRRNLDGAEQDASRVMFSFGFLLP
jgi:hypothetical protein